MSNYSRYDRYSTGRYAPASSSRYASSSSSSSSLSSRPSLYSSQSSSSRPSYTSSSNYVSSRYHYNSDRPTSHHTYHSPIGGSTNSYFRSKPTMAVCTNAGRSRRYSPPSPETLTPRPTEICSLPIPELPKISSVDLLVAKNAEDHHTDSYEMCQEGYVDDITKKSSPAKLIVRRGQEFKVKVSLDKDYDSFKDKIRVNATFGPTPLISKGTVVQMVTGKAALEKSWSAKATSSGTKEVELSISSPATCPVGKWVFILETIRMDDSGGISKLEEGVKYEAIILFNAWCKDDSVYLGDSEWRDEYVLNDTGKIYTGSSAQIFGKPWNFGQFESVTLQAALYILDEISGIAATARGNPVIISRRLSALVNSNDDSGILVGRWGSNYEGGTKPTQWTGSVAILQKYMDTRKPVCFGQCWVFSGLLTAVSRTLGLPARSVTNFESAHDTDGSLTIDFHFDSDNEYMKELETDMIWNFHVWNEIWMARPELKSGYGGWQAVDATPQETSDGIYCAGPAPVAAIKNGDVGCSYDASFIFAEVNGDRVDWFHSKDGGLHSYAIDKDVVGFNISTKARGRSGPLSRYNNSDREDVTDQYKFAEGSKAERAAVWRAAQISSTKPSVYFDKKETKKDIVLSVGKPEDGVQIGSDISISILVVNQSSSERTVDITANLSSVYYTGVTKTKLKKQSFTCKVAPNSREECVMMVKAKDYMNDLADHNSTLKINIIGCVTETKQIIAKQDIFRLRTVVPNIEPSKNEVKVGEDFAVTVNFENPLKMPLTGCQFTFESAGNLKPTIAGTSANILPGGAVNSKCDITAKRVGVCAVISSFECNELEDIQACCTVLVSK